MIEPDQKTLAGKVISPTKLAHVVLQTSNYKSMVAFYKAFLGARASFEDQKLAFLTYDDEHHRIAIANLPQLRGKDVGSAGMHHMAFAFDSLDDLLLAYQQRKARGILPTWSVNHGPTTSLYYQDPDGNRIETQVDNFDTREQEDAFLRSEAFEINPIGVDFDPEDLIQRLRNGEDPGQIKKRADIGPRGFDSVPTAPAPLVRDSYEPVVT